MRYLIGESSWATVNISTRLTKTGTLVTRCDDPDDLPLYHELMRHDLMLLDQGMLKQGVRIARLRGLMPDVPVCVLADRNDPEGWSRILAGGADMVFEAGTPLDEINARLCAVARRGHGLSGTRIKLGALEIDLATRTAWTRGTRLALAPKVYETLEYLALRPGQTVTRDALLSHVYLPGEEPRVRVFDVYMNTLRGHLENLRNDIAVITQRGVGFRLEVGAGLPERAEVA